MLMQKEKHIMSQDLKPVIEFEDFEFIYTNKSIVEKDLIQVASKFRLYEKIGNFTISDDIYRELKKLPLLVYVDSVDELSPTRKMLYIKTSKTSSVLKHAYPAELFKAVKVPKTYDLVGWLTDENPRVEFPSSWEFFKNELSYAVPYLANLFIYFPRIIREVNRLTNSLYDNWDYKELLVYYKKIIQANKLRYSDLYTKYDGKTARKEFIDICLSINKFWTEEDAKSLYALSADPKRYNSFSNVDLVKYFKDPKAAMLSKKLDAASFEAEAAKVDELLLQIQQDRIKNDKRFIKELNQEVIDEMELTLFNTSTVKSLNSVLFTFIDKTNQKIYYLAPFEFEFYVSYNNSILMNDYIVPFNPNIHTKYRIVNHKDMKALKYVVNNSYDKFMKSGGTI